MRILIEGPDLAGKSTVAFELTSACTMNGFRVHSFRDTSCAKGFFRRLLSYVDAPSHPKSRLLNAAYILCGAAESRRIANWSCHKNELLLCETHVDRSICYGTAIGLRPIPQLALAASRIFPTFDIAILLVASFQERNRRLRLRPHANLIDHMTCRDECTHDKFIAAYRRALRRHREVLEYNTDKVDPRDIANDIFSRISSGTSAVGVNIP